MLRNRMEDGLIALDLPPELAVRPDRLATETGRKPADLVLEALREMLDDVEDVAIAEQRLFDARAAGERFIPIEDLIARHGLED
jgi:predicted DNA-binding protein